MDVLPLHPKLVHLPIALAVLMPLISVALLAAWRGQWLPRRAWIVAVALQAILVISGVVAIRTGGTEEERVEKVVAESAIEAHEEAAEAFVWGAAVLLVLALGAAALPDERTARMLATAATAGTLVVLFLGYRTGEAGGRLVYQHGAASVYATGTAGGAGADAGEAAKAAKRGGGEKDRGGEDDDDGD